MNSFKQICIGIIIAGISISLLIAGIIFLLLAFDPSIREFREANAKLREEIQRTQFDNANSVCNLYQQFKELIKQDPEGWKDVDFEIFKENCRDAGRPQDQ